MLKYMHPNHQGVEATPSSVFPYLIDRYISCTECGFILLASNAERPRPERHRTCPGCDGTEFRFESDELTALEESEPSQK